MTSTSCVAQRSARLIIQLQLLLKFHETDEALPLALPVVDRFCNRAMCRLIRVLLVSVPLLFVFLVAPSAFAQSWISGVTATTQRPPLPSPGQPPCLRIRRSRTVRRPATAAVSALNSTLVTTHSVTLTSLTAGTTYHYRVLSADSTGVLVTGLDNVFTTPAAAISVSSLAHHGDGGLGGNASSSRLKSQTPATRRLPGRPPPAL